MSITKNVLLFLLAWSVFPACLLSADLPRVRVADDKGSFVLDGSNEPFVPWGVNYDHDESGRLIEDYWNDEWPKLEEDFREIRQLGANVVRIHLQFGQFMQAPAKPNGQALEQLARLTRLAERLGLYLDLTGLACYHKPDVPDWYDELSEADRWEAQAEFWRAIARTCQGSPAVFCYDLMNEPVVPGGDKVRDDWLGPPFAGKYFVQFVTLDRAGRERSAVAREWVEKLSAAIREHDHRALITVGLVNWSLDRPGLTSGFVPEVIAGPLDFVSVHLYPEKSKVDEALRTLAGFEVGKPVVIEETFPLKCGLAEMEQFLTGSVSTADGWISFYWGKTPEELRRSGTLGDAILLKWLETFRKGPPSG